MKHITACPNGEKHYLMESCPCGHRTQGGAVADNQQRAQHPALTRHKMRRAREVLDSISPFLRWQDADVQVIKAALDAAEARGRAEVTAKFEALAVELRQFVHHADSEAREWEGDPHRVSEWQGKASAYAWAAIRLRDLIAEESA